MKNLKEELPNFIKTKDNRLIPVITRKKGNTETDKCPYCKDTHIHGTLPGHRIAHCTGKFSINVNDTIIENNVGYVILEY